MILAAFRAEFGDATMVNEAVSARPLTSGRTSLALTEGPGRQIPLGSLWLC